MANLDFRLEPHDTAFDNPSPPFEVVTAESHLGMPYVLGWGEAYKNMVTARVLIFQAPTGPLWRIVPKDVSPDSYWFASREVSFNVNEEVSLRDKLTVALEQNLGAHLFFLNEDARLRQIGEVARYAVLLTPRGWGQWRQLGRLSDGRVYTRSEAGFWYSVSSSSIAAPASDLWESLRPELNFPDSPLHFAREFAALSKNHRYPLWNWKRGNQHEFEQVVYSLFLSQPKWWQTPRHIEWILNIKGRTGTLVPRDGRPRPRRTPTLGKSLDKVWNYFSPTVDAEAQQKHLELKRLFNFSEDVISMTANDPTRHEQLEAVLRWREWESEHP